MLNGINLDELEQYIKLITEKPAEAISNYGITDKWVVVPIIRLPIIVVWLNTLCIGVVYCLLF
ncbi:MAG: hypothetical protein COA88_06380 [Kordia sp.]|nr:MAG: hypothetical protein COA88_06380 [Kordia sp.]